MRAAAESATEVTAPPPLRANAADLGLLNRRRIIAAVAQHGTATRSGLARTVGLTRPAVSRIVSDLVGAGLLSESEPQAGSGRGRPTGFLHLMPDRHLFVGIDIRLEGVIVEGRDLAGRVLVESRHPLSAGATAKRAVDLIARAVERCSRQVGRPVDGIGLSVGAGQNEDWTVVTGSPYRPWRMVPLPRLVAERFPDRPIPIRMADVSGSAALANWMELCADPDLDDLVHLQMGVGAGSGWVRRSQGLPHLAKPANIAHLPVQESGRPCVCGARGCFDAMAGFDALVEASHATGLRPVVGPRMIESYCAELLALAEQGDAAAVAAIEEMALWFAHGAAMLINILRPSRFTYGGYPVLLGTVFADHFTRTLTLWVPDLSTVLARTELGDHASATGAYWLATSSLMSETSATSP